MKSSDASILKYISCTLLLWGLAGLSRAQSSAELSLTHEVVTAGDTVSATITFAQPVACDTGALVIFGHSDPALPFTVGLSAQVKRGDTTVTLTGKINLDAPGGEYRSTGLQFNPCPNYSHGTSATVPSTTMMVKALTNTMEYPTHAELSLKPSQKQFLDTKIADLDDLDQQITTKLEGSAADTQATRTFLRSITQEAQSALVVTERQYRSQFVDPNGQAPAFFADFREQYQNLLVDLNAPIPGLYPSTAANTASMIEVQWDKRKSGQHLDGGVRSSTTHSPDVVSVRKTIHDNAAAYRYVKDTGRITFDVRVVSIPSGASVQYKKVIDPAYKDYGSPTDIPKVTLDLAAWTFRFSLAGCSDIAPVITIDPYDGIPEVEAHFHKCKGNR